MAIDPKQYPRGWLQPGERWPGQNHGIPEPGTPESAEYHRKAWEEESGKPRPQPPSQEPHAKPLAPVPPRVNGLRELADLVKSGELKPPLRITLKKTAPLRVNGLQELGELLDSGKVKGPLKLLRVRRGPSSSSPPKLPSDGES
jgi:hypothetical protein